MAPKCPLCGSSLTNVHGTDLCIECGYVDDGNDEFISGIIVP